jgi:hypothetical protein
MFRDCATSLNRHHKLDRFSVSLSIFRRAIFTLLCPYKGLEAQFFVGLRGNEYNYHNSGHYRSPCLLFKTYRFEGWILSPSSDGTYSVGPKELVSDWMRSPSVFRWNIFRWAQKSRANLCLRTQLLQLEREAEFSLSSSVSNTRREDE